MRSFREEAHILLKQGIYKQADACFTMLTITCPMDTSSWIGLGISAFFQGELERAERAFHVAMNLQPENLSAYLWNIECLLKQGKKAESARLFSKIQDTVINDSALACHKQQLQNILREYVYD